MSDERDRKRFMGDDERALLSKPRRASSPASPTFVEEELTGQYEGPELAERRAQRRPDKRLEKLEAFKDAATADISAIKLSIVKIEGDTKLTASGIQSIKEILAERDKRDAERHHRERVTFEAHVDVETAEQIADVEVRKSKAIETHKARIERITKVVGAVVGLLTSGAVLHYIASKL